MQTVTIKAPNQRRIYDQSYVRTMFDSIAYRYDILNHLLSSGLDILWRKKAIRLLAEYHPNQILDVATGTADLAIEAAHLQPQRIVGVDISEKMLERARVKIQKKNLNQVIALQACAAEKLPFSNETFDVAMAAFGVRNFENLNTGLAEFYRVLKDGGIALVLEFSRPKKFPIQQLYNFYSKTLLPTLGGLISKNKTAYEYLPNTVAEFPDGEDFCNILRSVGFSKVEFYTQTFGIATIYIAGKENLK
jgi:demethylmenaquinone methyltransferase/2-methoxy-6-polyprenyl-1,4-benzoquinol methylase